MVVEVGEAVVDFYQEKESFNLKIDPGMKMLVVGPAIRLFERACYRRSYLSGRTEEAGRQRKVTRVNEAYKCPIIPYLPINPNNPEAQVFGLYRMLILMMMDVKGVLWIFFVGLVI